MDPRPYHEQLTAEEFRALLFPREADKMPYRLHVWGLVEHGMVYHHGYARPRLGYHGKRFARSIAGSPEI